MARVHWPLTIILLVAAASSAAAELSYSHVRARHARVEPFLRQAIERSPLVRQLVATLDASDVIVYLEMWPALGPAHRGAIIFAADAGGFRYLRVRLHPGNPPEQMIAAIGHELQHAVEIAAAPWVRSSRDLVEHYKRVGIPSAGGKGWDTQAARDAGQLVRLELRDDPP